VSNIQTKDHEQQATALLNTSASDCECTLMLLADSRPIEALSVVSCSFRQLNAAYVERKAHRQAFLKAGRKALKKLGEF
jgi:hypothetical protein